MTHVLALIAMVTATGLLIPSSSHASIVYNAATDFSASTNPNGVWSFGSQPTLGTGFAPFPDNGNLSGFGLDYWTNAPIVGHIDVIHNPTNATINWFSLVINAGQLVMHPGPLGEYTGSRFTAPLTGDYQFHANFVGQDSTSTDVHLLVNGSSVFSGTVAGFQNTASSGTFNSTLLAGDTIDAAVGFGTNGNFFNDSDGCGLHRPAIDSPRTERFRYVDGTRCDRWWTGLCPAAPT